jgi:hypothetical protein
MTTSNEKTASGNRTGSHHEIERLTKAINTAIARARLTCSTLESIAVSLRHKQATPAEVLQWLKDERLEQLVTRHMRGGV